MNYEMNQMFLKNGEKCFSFVILLNKIFSLIFSIPILLYKFLISPMLPKCCRFYPSCSTYFLEALKTHNVFYGCFLGIKRLLKCNGFFRGGYDPVPKKCKEKIKLNSATNIFHNYKLCCSSKNVASNVDAVVMNSEKSNN